MIIDCKTHGEVQARVDIHCNAWCPICWEDMLLEGLRISSEKPKPDTLPTETWHSMGSHTAGIEPVYTDKYVRRVKVDD